MQTRKATSEPMRVFAMPIDYQSFQKSVKINKKKLVKISGWEQVNNFEKVSQNFIKMNTPKKASSSFLDRASRFGPEVILTLPEISFIMFGMNWGSNW